jgi:hypothetical protein
VQGSFSIKLLTAKIGACTLADTFYVRRWTLFYLSQAIAMTILIVPTIFLFVLMSTAAEVPFERWPSPAYLTVRALSSKEPSP